jgi:hypothetical protein
MFWTGTLFRSDERVAPGLISQSGAPVGTCINASFGAGAACPTSCLADLLGKASLSDEPAPGAGAASPASCLVDLFAKLGITNEPAPDTESIGSTNPSIEPVVMLIDSDAASANKFPTYVVVIDDPLPLVASVNDASTIAEVLVTGHGDDSAGAAQDPLRAAM